MGCESRVYANDNLQTASLGPHLRMEPIVSIHTGAWTGVSARFSNHFEDWNALASGPVCASSARWLASAIEAAGRMALSSDVSERPITLIAPFTALCQSDAAQLARDGARRCNMRPDEFRLEFPDAALTIHGAMGMKGMRVFARRGFRVGLDARHGLRTSKEMLANSPVEALRLNSEALDLIEMGKADLLAASDNGMNIYAENARWPGARNLLSWGVSAVIVAPSRMVGSVPF